VVTNVVFEEPEELNIKPREVVEREPGVLAGQLIDWGLVKTVTQAKIAITLIVIVGFMATVYYMEAALDGPDIPPRPPSPAYEAFVQERLQSS
jgi:hypothetical protein